MLSYRPVGVENQIVIVFLTYYLPQHQHPAPGVLATWSLALLATFRANQQTTPERGLHRKLTAQLGLATLLLRTPAATASPIAEGHRALLPSCYAHEAQGQAMATM